jgi:hypothetical protein
MGSTRGKRSLYKKNADFACAIADVGYINTWVKVTHLSFAAVGGRQSAAEQI